MTLTILKKFKIVFINHDFNFKLKTVVDDYGFEFFFFKWSKSESLTTVLSLKLKL